MNTSSERAVLADPVTVAFVALAALLAFVTTFSYLGGFVDPVGNMHNMPLAIVNEDEGALVGGQRVSFGDEVVAAVLAPDPGAGDAVKWTVLDTRATAIDRIGVNDFYAAIVVPRSFSSDIVALANPQPDLELAQIEILTNPAAGSIAGAEGQAIANGVVERVSGTTSERLVTLLESANTTIAPGAAPALADPVRGELTVARPTGAKSARGLAPFYFAVMITLGGFIGTNVVSVGVDFVTGTIHLDVLASRLRRKPLRPSRLSVWRMKALLALVMSVLAGLLETWMAVGILGMTGPNAITLSMFAVLGTAAISTATLFFITAFGSGGLVLGVLFTTIFGVPSAGGVYPLEMLPPFFRFLSTWLPLRYITDGTRALMFFDGKGDAGLSAALWVLSAYFVAASVLGALTAFGIDRVSRGRRESAEV